MNLPADDLDDTMKAPARETRPVAPTATAFTERCPRCAGSGRYGRLGQCFKCKGKGSLSFATSFADRAKVRGQRVARKARSEAEMVEAFAKAEPEVFAWIDGNSFGFAVAMLDAVKKWGGLTVNQLAACHRNMEKLAAARAAGAARVDAAKPVNVDALAEAFAKAAAGAKRAPRLLIGVLKIAPAKSTSANAGALYVHAPAGYLGKIAGGRFLRSRECTPAQEAEVLEVLADPKAAAIKSGRLTGTCSVCARELTDPESIAAGIGPVCAANFGW